MPQTSTPRATSGYAQSERTRHRERHHSTGGANHWVRTVGALAPLVIGELVKDPEQKWRFIRITSVLLAVASEASYAHRLHKERQERDAQEARDDAITR
jgi:hypothetical protein